MIRLQHYAELLYIVGGMVWAFDVYRMARVGMLKEMKFRDWAKAFTLLAFAPICMALVFRQAYRD